MHQTRLEQATKEVDTEMDWVEKKKSFFTNWLYKSVWYCHSVESKHVQKVYILLSLENMQFICSWLKPQLDLSLQGDFQVSKLKNHIKKNKLNHSQCLPCHWLIHCNILYTPIYSNASRICNKNKRQTSVLFTKKNNFAGCFFTPKSTHEKKKKAKRHKRNIYTVNHLSFIYN